MTSAASLTLARIAFAVACAAAAVLMLAKPFQGLEAVFGLNDKAAHALAFYGLAAGLFVVVPLARRGDLTLFVIAAALTIELLQSLTGRSVSLGDFFAGAAGATAAWLPGVLEEVRRSLRGDADRRLSGAPRPSRSSAGLQG